MVEVQAAGCAPILREFEKGTLCREFPSATTASVAVPKAIGDFLILEPCVIGWDSNML